MGSEENWLSKINIPSVALGRTGEALSRLVGAPLGALAARLERGEAVIQARTDGQAEFQRIVGRSAANEALQDPEFMQRAMETFGRDLVNKQLNKEAVAVTSIKKLEENGSSKVEDSDASSEITDDWMNYFSRYAEGASSVELRDRLAKVFAGEVVEPGSFSLAAIRTIAELDSNNAKIIKRVLNHDLGGALVYAKSAIAEKRLSHNDLVVLQGLGLITGLGGILSKNLEIKVTDASKPTTVFWPAVEKNCLLQVTVKAGVKLIKFQAYPLTSLGKEILSLTDRLSNEKFAEHLKSESNGAIENIGIISQNYIHVEAKN